MGALNQYMQDVQRLSRDTRAEMVNPETIIDYINIARREIALRAQCLRVLTPVSGAVVSATVVAGGTGYTAPTVTITPPDFPSGIMPYPQGLQATALANLGNAGAISGVNIQVGGSGYWQPQATISDPTGTGASVVLTTRGANQIVQGQERIDFKDVNLSPFPGFGTIYNVRSVSILYANYRYSLPMYSLSTYQAMIRRYTQQYQYVPAAGCQVGQGSSGYFLLYPIPSQPLQIEFDAFCTPSDLSQDTDYEALPSPWTEAVKFYALHLLYAELQNFNVSRMYFEMFERQMKVYSTSARPGRVTNPYGRF